MILILTNLPNNTDNKQIEDFIRPAIKNSHMGSIAIITRRNKRTKEIQRHALVRVAPDIVAKEAIKILNGKPLSGKPTDVHEYKTRLWYNDPRFNNTVNNDIREKRKGDRRQFL